MGTDPQYPLIFISDMRKILAFLLFRIFAFISAEAGSMEEQAGYCNGNECCAAETLFQVERFEMVIFEAPEKVVQVVTYDNAAGLKFVDVPKHRDLMKTRHVTDMEDEQVVSEDQPGDMIVRDPEIQRDYMNGDFLDFEEEKRPEGLSNFTRYKRSAPCMQISDDNQLTSGSCFWVEVNCERNGGCPATNIFFHCRDNSGPSYRSCEYILMCSTVTDNRCIIHSRATGVTCDMCCSTDNCAKGKTRGL